MKKIKTAESFEETVARFRNDRVRHLPEPVYFFDIGEEVSIGRLENVIVLDAFDNGMFYLISYTSTDNNYRNPIYSEKQRLVTYLEIRPKIEYNHDIIENQDSHLHFSQTSLSDVLNKIYYFGCDMNPEYQRGYVWELSDKEYLIESIFKNVDIGKFVFVRREYSDDILYEILDGKQRLNTLCEYYENKFSWNGLYFNDLGVREQGFFGDYHVSIATIEDATREQKIRYFINLNRSGKVMSKSHLDRIAKLIGE